MCLYGKKYGFFQSSSAPSTQSGHTNVRFGGENGDFLAHLLALTPLVLKTYHVSGTKLYVDEEMENHGFHTTVWCSGYQGSF